MKNTIMFTQDTDNFIKIEVMDTELVPNKNMCDCCYVKVIVGSKLYNKLKKIANIDISNKKDNGININKSENDLIQYYNQNTYDIWILKDYIGKEFGMLGYIVKFKKKYLEITDTKEANNLETNNANKVEDENIENLENVIYINYDFVAGNEVSYVEALKCIDTNTSFSTNCLTFFNSDCLLDYDDILVRKKCGDYISAKELLSNSDNSYTDKFITPTHSLYRMLTSNALKFKSRNQNNAIKEDGDEDDTLLKNMDKLFVNLFNMHGDRNFDTMMHQMRKETVDVLLSKDVKGIKLLSTVVLKDNVDINIALKCVYALAKKQLNVKVSKLITIQNGDTLFTFCANNDSPPLTTIFNMLDGKFPVYLLTNGILAGKLIPAKKEVKNTINNNQILIVPHGKNSIKAITDFKVIPDETLYSIVKSNVDETFNTFILGYLNTVSKMDVETLDGYVFNGNAVKRLRNMFYNNLIIFEEIGE